MAYPRFRTSPVPDTEVIALLETALDAARRGHVRTVAIVTVNPLNLTETAHAGDLGPIRANALLGGIVRAKSSVIPLI